MEAVANAPKKPSCNMREHWQSDGRAYPAPRRMEQTLKGIRGYLRDWDHYSEDAHRLWAVMVEEEIRVVLSEAKAT